MREAKLQKLSEFYKAIGDELVSILGNPDGAFLYVEAGEGWIGPSLFKDEGAQVRYIREARKLDDLLLDFWEAEDPDKRWAAMEYSVTGTKFHVEFVFPENFDEELGPDERREMVLNARYGDKPRVYPPLPSVEELIKQLEAEHEAGTKRH